MNDMMLCGWRLRSEIGLPELSPWCGGDRPVDIMVSLGSVPDRLHDIVVETPFLQIDNEGICRLEVPLVGVFMVRAGWDIVIAPRVSPASVEIRNFILGPVLGLLAHQRNLVPMQASAVCIDGVAVAFAGVSRTGKSTIAAALARRGHSVLADDICVIDPTGHGGPVVLPSSSYLRLWQDACATFGLVPDTGEEPVRTAQERYFISVAGFPALGHPIPLGFIHLLGDITAQDHAVALVAQVYGHVFAGAFGDGEGRVRRAATLADVVPIVRLGRTSLDNVDALARDIERTCLEHTRRKWACA